MRFISIDTTDAREAEALARYRASQQAMQEPQGDVSAPGRSSERTEASTERDHVGQPMPRGSRLPEPEAAEAGPAWVNYTVQSGDTLRGIAEWFYGDRSRAEIIYAANRSMIPDPEALEAGVVLTIPRRRGDAKPLA